jgi:Dehydrogenases with different specificities (related to short-chain alcohol dehydrogenases)
MKVKYYDLENKRVFITGGGSGIGASIVEHFCEQGSEVYFIDINVTEATKLIEDIKNKKFLIPTFIECDLLNIKQLQKTIADIIGQKGPIDILINNAANDTRHKIDEVTEEYWNERMNVNLRHYFFTVQSVKKSMIENGGGSIINMGSTSWMIGQGGMPAYTAAKSGVVGLTRSFARDLGEFNIRVNSVVPGWVLTQRQKDLWLNEESKKELRHRQCLKEGLMPHELAQVVLFFSSEQASGCTNQSYVVIKAGYNKFCESTKLNNENKY